MAIYVSQATYNAGTDAQRATWTVDPTISSPGGTPQVTVSASQNPQLAYSPPAQTSSTLTTEQKQQILFQNGLAYGNPDAPEYQSLYVNASPAAPKPVTPQVQAPQSQQYTSQMTQAQLNQIQTSQEFKAANAPGVVGGMSLASGGYVTFTQNNPVYVPPSPTQAKAIEIAAGLEQLPVIAQLKGASEYISSSAQGTIFEIPVNYVVAPALRTPEMIGKTGIAATGILSAAITGDVQAFQQGVPASRAAFVQAATDPLFYASSALTAGIIYKAGYSNLISERPISSEIQPRTSILARTETGLGTEFVARTSDIVSVTTAKTIAGVEVPFTRSTAQYSAAAETSGISLRTPELSQTAKLGSVEGQPPMLVQTRAATGVELSQAVSARFVPEWATKGVQIKEVSGFKPSEGASVGATYGEFPSNVPYGEALVVKAAPSFETTSIKVSYPTLAKGEVYSEISPTYKGVFEPTKSPAQYTSDISSVRAVSAGGKISEITGTFKEMASTNEQSFYGISLKEGKATTTGIGMVEPGGFRTPIGEGEVFPRMVSPKDITTFKTSRGTTEQLQITKIESEAGKAGTSAIQSLVSEMKTSQKTGVVISPVFLQPKSASVQATQEMTQFRQASVETTAVKESAFTGLKGVGLVSLKSFTATQPQTSQASSYKSLSFQPSFQPTEQGTSLKSISQQPIFQPQSSTMKMTEITGLSELTKQPSITRETYRISEMTIPSTTTGTATIPIQTSITGLTGVPLVPMVGVPNIGIPNKPPFGGGLGGLFPSDQGNDLSGMRGKRQKGRYQPSFVARELGIHETKSQALKSEKMGFSIRGLIGSNKKGR